MTNKARVLIVDDSSTMRRIIRHELETDPRLDVVAEASCASEARDMINELRPDVMTLDVEMPQMNGIDFLKRVMKHRPMPVVMVSTLTKKGSQAAIEALASGAVDCVEKPSAGDGSHRFGKLSDIVCMAAAAKIFNRNAPRRAAPQVAADYRSNSKIVAIGGSTGAVDAIERILKEFPQNCPPTLICQHMPAPFLKSFAARLDPLVAPTVKLAEQGEVIEPGKVLIAPGGDYHLALNSGARMTCNLENGPLRNGHRPSVDVLFESVAAIGRNAVCAILTGMGQDGAAGLLAAKNAGAMTIGQNEESCVVFGMPRVAGELGAVDRWLDLDDIASAILKECAAPLGARV